MTDELRWGFLSTGWVAGEFIDDLTRAGVKVTAVGSRSQKAADAFGERWGIPNRHGSYEALVADPEVDIVYIATPHPFHAANATLALEAGKHVLVEKAFTMNAVEARAVVELAAERGLVVQEAMWTRFLPHMARIREIIAAGTIGELRTLIADHDQRLPQNPEHRLQDPALGGGALLDLAIYPVSFAWDLFGAPAEIRALSAPTATGVDQSTAILFGYPGGGQAVLHSELDAAGPGTAVIIGTEGRIELDRIWQIPTTFRVIATDGTVIETYVSEVEGRGMQFQAFAVEKAVREGTGSAPEMPAAQTVAIMESLDAIREQIGLRYPGE